MAGTAGVDWNTSGMRRSTIIVCMYVSECVFVYDTYYIFVM